MHPTHSRRTSLYSNESAELSTPSVTEGESATETDEPQTDYEESETENEARATPVARDKARQQSNASSSSFGLMTGPSEQERPRRSRSPMSQHDLFNRYFRKDAILVHNVDLLR